MGLPKRSTPKLVTDEWGCFDIFLEYLFPIMLFNLIFEELQEGGIMFLRAEILNELCGIAKALQSLFIHGL